MYNDWSIQIIKQGEEKMDNFEQRTWSDTTPGKSYVERLNFDPDRYWTTVRIEILGKTDETTYDLNLNLGGVKVKNYSKDNLRKGEKVVYEYAVDAQTSISVVGSISRSCVLHEAGAEITVTACYEGEMLKTEKVSWGDRTGGISVIEGLGMDDLHTWKTCVIRVKGDKNLQSFCTLTLIVDGDEYGRDQLDQSFTIHGTSSKEFQFDIHKKASLLVVGYISNNDVFTGAGVDIELEATYE